MQGGSSNGVWSEKDEDRVRSSTCCSDHALIRQALEQAHGDIDAAIEQVGVRDIPGLLGSALACLRLVMHADGNAVCTCLSVLGCR